MVFIAEINKDRTLDIFVDTGCDNIWIDQITVYGCESFNAGKPCYTFEYQTNTWATSEHLAQNELNCRMNITDPQFNDVDFLNDLVMIQVRFRYSDVYSESHPCCMQPECLQTAVYFKCRIYERIMNAIGSAEDMCADLGTSAFVDEVLKKKMIDTCIDAKEFQKACKLWNKFYSTGKSFAKGGCGCGGH